jgi:ubiquinone/menaquinone biosynthesis C-methylase UbiE
MSESKQQSEYLLGVNERELARLQFQHAIWGPVTQSFLQRLGTTAGWRCLDVGAGPGLVTTDLRELVGESGEVIALDPSELYITWLEQQVARRNWSNVRCIQGTAEEAPLPRGHFDIVFVRWVIAFVPNPGKFLARLAATLKPGGILAIQDYYYEALSLYPHGGPCDEMASIVRAYYRSAGGDAYITAKVPGWFRNHGLTLTDFTPTCLCGGPDSDVFEWAYQFFSQHIPLMADRGLISRDKAEALLADWKDHRNNPDTFFFSPLVVDVAGTLPQ